MDVKGIQGALGEINIVSSVTIHDHCESPCKVSHIPLGQDLFRHALITLMNVSLPIQLPLYHAHMAIQSQ